MKRFAETVDNHVCNGLNLCPKGWKALDKVSDEIISDLEMEL